MNEASLRRCVEAVEDARETVESFKRIYDEVQTLLAEEREDKIVGVADSELSGAWEALRQWLQSAGGFVHSSLQLRSFGDAGRGVVAHSALEADAELFRIPRAAVLSEEAAAKDARLASLQSQFALLSQIPSALLALFLLLERERPNSHWKPYLRLLPDRFSIPLYWTWEEIVLLRGSAAFSASLQMWRNAVRMYVLVSQICQQNAKVLGISKPPTFGLWRWALGAVYTRRNFVPFSTDPKKQALALIPGWDMCNFRAGHITTEFDVAANCVKCFAMSSCAAGDQVFIYYGDRPSSDLLVHNGFLPSDEDVTVLKKRDYVLLRMALNQNDPLFEKRKALLASQRLPPAIDFAIRSEFVPNCPALVFCRVSRMKAEDFDRSANPVEKVDDANEKAAYDMLDMAIAIQIKKLAPEPEGTVIPKTYHAQCAVRLKEIERSVLQSFLDSSKNARK